MNAKKIPAITRGMRAKFLRQQGRKAGCRWRKAPKKSRHLQISTAIMNLFGLTTFAVNRRTKEIGMRTVLKASRAGIVKLLSQEFSKLILLAFVLAVPLAWIFRSKMVRQFRLSDSN